jgi:hypothetical protein
MPGWVGHGNWRKWRTIAATDNPKKDKAEAIRVVRMANTNPEDRIFKYAVKRSRGGRYEIWRSAQGNRPNSRPLRDLQFNENVAKHRTGQM